ncbi:MAG: helix-turn-helix transcriptional regulator [bacterium]
MTTPAPIQFTTLVGAALEAIRRDLGLTQRQAAARLGWSQATLSLMENGRTGVRVEQLARWAAALGVAPSAVLAQAEALGALAEAEGRTVLFDAATSAGDEVDRAALRALFAAARQG